jgi:putative ABC transport system substrate-binding protein
VKSLADPGGNITGECVRQIDATIKRVELIHELMPSARRIALLTDDFTIDQLDPARRAVRALGLELVSSTAASKVPPRFAGVNRSRRR